MRLALVYAMLALLSIAANIGTQDVVVHLYHGSFAVVLSVFMGTGVGLVVKYVLDKRYIFGFKADNVAHDGRIFVLYTLMGVFTTSIFWGFEFAFHHVFATDGMRYLGGVMGLVIGYFLKYELDKRYVFRRGNV